MTEYQQITARVEVTIHTFAIDLTEDGLNLKTGRFNKAAVLNASIYAVYDDEITTDDLSNRTASVYIMDEKVFSGEIKKVTKNSENSFNIVAYDALYELKNSNIQASFEYATVEAIASEVEQQAGVLISVGNRQSPIEYLLEQTLPVILGIEVGDFSDYLDAFASAAGNLSPVYLSRRADKVVVQLAQWTNTAYWVDVDNIVHIEPPDSEKHYTYKIIDHNAEIKSPPYRSVEVMGISPTPIAGVKVVHLLEESPPLATSGEGEPQYTYYSAEIFTADVAQSVADAILKELKRQAAGGTITIPGNPEIRPLDVVTLPPGIGDGATYLVDELEHDISSDGFTTTITCGNPVF